MDPLQQDTTLDNTLGGTSSGTSSFKTKKQYDPKRRRVMMSILSQGNDPNELRRQHILHGYDEDEVNDAIDTYQRVTSGQPAPKEEEGTGTTAKDYANAIRNKQITFNEATKDLTEEGRDAIVKELSGLGATETATEKEKREAKLNTVPNVEEKIKTIDELKDDWYLDAAVGTNPLVRHSLTNWATGGKDEFIGKVQQILDQATLDKLIEIKGEGATLGALSDSEREMLQKSASPIWSWTVKDDDDKIVGYDINEKAFKEELERLKKEAERKKENITKEKANEGVTSSGLKYIIE